MSETEKAQIRDLTAGIGAVIGGAVGDSSYNAQLAGVIGQNATENNEMGIFPVNSELMQSADSLARDLSNKNVDPITTQKEMEILLKGKVPDHADIIKHGGKAWLNLVSSAIPVSGGYKVYQGGKWIFLSLSQTQRLNQAAKAAGFNGVISGTISAVSGDDREGIIANTFAGAGLGSASSIFKPLQTVKGQVVGGSTSNIGAQNLANINRESNGKQPIEINSLNAVAAGLVSGAVHKVGLKGVDYRQPVVIGTSATLNAVTSGNKPNKTQPKNKEK